MSNNTSEVLAIFIFFGWIPILSLGKAISWIIQSVNENKKNDEERGN